MERFKQYASGALPNEIVPYKALHKGRRYWVFQNIREKPFLPWIEDHAIVMYDRSQHIVLAIGKQREDGSIHGSVMWETGIPFEAPSPRAMVIEVISILKADLWSRVGSSAGSLMAKRTGVLD